MAVHAYLMAILFATPVGGAADVLTDRMEETLLVSANWVLADVNRVSVVLATEDTPHIKPVFDALDVGARIERKLSDAGIIVITQGTETTPKLVVHIEGMEVPGSDKWVFRVQTALSRLVTVPGRETRHLLTEVWRVGPVMNVVGKAEAGGAICDAALVHVGVFADTQKTARSLLETAKDAPGTTSSAAPYPFVASKSGKAFHRPDCRWAQNISADNLITYQSRDEAVQSGKRPCKSCKP